MFCSNCGKEMEENAKFCSNCGAENNVVNAKKSEDSSNVKKEKKKFKKKIIVGIIITVIIAMVVIVGIVMLKSKSKKDLIIIEKVYYTELTNNYSMYVVYSIKSDNKENITTAGSSNLISDTSEYGNSFFTYDINKSVIESAGFPTLVSYKTLYAGSEQKLKYVAHFTIGKKEIEDNSKLKLSVSTNGKAGASFLSMTYDYLEKEFRIKDVNNFLYNENTEFIKEFEKDYK